MRHGTQDGRQRAGNKEQRSETGEKGWDTRNRDVRQGTKSGKTRNREVRHGTEVGRQEIETLDLEQRMGYKKHRRETGNKGRETRNRVRHGTEKGDMEHDVRQGIKCGKQGTEK